jgi:hypothetical protein
MTMPGFSAEASLYIPKERYRASFSTSMADGNKVVAATWACQCYSDPVIGIYCVCHFINPHPYPSMP